MVRVCAVAAALASAAPALGLSVAPQRDAALQGLAAGLGVSSKAKLVEQRVNLRQSLMAYERDPTPPTQLSSGDAKHGEVTALDGAHAALSEEGLQHVLQARSRDQMVTFMGRVLESEGMHVKDAEMLRNVAAYYDGECMTQTYDTLVMELRNATRPYRCHAPWVTYDKPMFINENRAPYGWNLHLDEEPVEFPAHEEYAAAAASEKDMKAFIRGVVLRKGGAIIDEGRFSGFVPFYVGHSALEDYDRLLHELTAIHELPEDEAWVRFGGEYAPLSNEGYQAVLVAHIRGGMSAFVQRVIADQGLKLVQEGGLNGFLPWYNGMCSGQTYDHLVSELRSASVTPIECGGGWVEPL